MKTNFLITLSLLINIALMANATAESNLKAHVHGSLVLEASVEGKVANFSVDGPAESFIGFEYLPKTDREKKIFLDNKKLWTIKFLDLVSFDKSLKCNITETSFEQKVEGNHSDIEASSKITCDKDLKGKKISINLKKYFKQIKKLKLELIGNETKSVEVNSDAFEVSL